jgi:hypothetical protein
VGIVGKSRITKPILCSVAESSCEQGHGQNGALPAERLMLETTVLFVGILGQTLVWRVSTCLVDLDHEELMG